MRCSRRLRRGAFIGGAARRGSVSAGGHLSPAPGDERCQRAMEEAVEVTQPLYACADEHKIMGKRDEHSAHALCR